MDTKKFSELSRIEQINLLIDMVSGHSHEPEIKLILSNMVAYNIDLTNGIRYSLADLCTDEIVDRLNAGMDGDYLEEERAWSCVIDTLNDAVIVDVIENIEHYMRRYSKITHHFDALKDRELHALFVMT